MIKSTHKIKEHLENGGTVLVDGIWYFTKDYMQCQETAHMIEYDYDGVCCEEHFETTQEAFACILDFCEEDEQRVEYV